ncbi:MAG: hypothetical protein M0R80_14670 [Proteobacteria bacterium]|nr:hypothetical protein [Pseudomonadota bacterium]
MDANATAAIFSLERYRTQWGHLPLVFAPFLGVTAAAIVLHALEPYMPEALATALLSAVGAAFAVFVLTLPRTWRRWRARGRLELRLDGGGIRLVDPGSQAIVGRCAATPDGVGTGEFLYAVNARFAGGTYRAPAIVLRCDGRSPMTVGVQGSRLTWRDPEERLARPDYLMGAAEWETLVEMIGMADRLVTVLDARAG